MAIAILMTALMTLINKSIVSPMSATAAIARSSSRIISNEKFILL